MDLILARNESNIDGIFSTLYDTDNRIIAHTLEHAYPDGGGFLPKIPKGTFTCQRSMHRLHGMTQDFETFEITGVEGHSNLLFHWGNFNRDSEGCILLGRAHVGSMITDSRATFAQFMNLQKDVDTFTLTVA